MVERTILRVFRAVELQSMVVDSGNVRPPLRQKWSPGRHVDVRSACYHSDSDSNSSFNYLEGSQ